MMKRPLTAIMLLMLSVSLSAQSYQFDSIPPVLRKGADAVIRSSQEMFEITGPGSATAKAKIVVTILNEKADYLRKIAVPYNKNVSVSNLRGIAYDEKGEIIKTLGAMDVQDRSSRGSDVFYTDSREKALSFQRYKYPYTIEFEYDYEMKGLVNYPETEFQGSPRYSVEKSGLQIVVHGKTPFRWRAKGLSNPIDSVIQGDERIYTWQEENLPAASRRNYTYRARYIPGILLTAPVDFEYGGYKGSMKSWESFGQWAYELNKGRDILPDEQKKKVAEIIAKASSEREKVKLLYEYMQSTTRYVLITLGIGGLQTAEAADVSKYGFGDCKALSNYMKSLLAEAGIKSYYTLVSAGDELSVSKDFVINHFNHVILSVPMQTDTIWLECTNQKKPFNYLGTFTDDRYALMVGPEGGRLVRTPAFKKGESLISRTGTVTLNNFGKSSVKLTNTYSGVFYDLYSGQLDGASDDEMKDFINAELRYSGVKPVTFRFSAVKSGKPTASLAYEASIDNFASLSGKMIIFNPSVERTDYIDKEPVDFEIRHYVSSYDSITYNLPLGYKVDFKPANTEISNQFGRFSYRIDVKNDKLIYRRSFDLVKSEIPNDESVPFREFINAVAKADRELVILKN